MQLSTFQEQVRHSEAAYRARPDAFSREAAFWAALPTLAMALALGAGALLFVWGLSLLSAGLGNVLSAVAAVGIAVFGACVAAAALVPVGVRLPEPEGQPLARHEAPGLYDGLDRLAQTFASEPVHAIHLVPGFDVRLVQNPRWGLIGPSTNTLVIGLALFMALDRRRLLVLAALASNTLRGRPEAFTARLVRRREVVQRVAERLAHNTRLLAQPARRLLAWLAPRLLARTQPLARHEVLVADRLVSKRVGADVWEAALKEAALKRAWMEQAFWPWLWLRAQRHETPKGPLRALKRKLSEPLAAEFARPALAALWRREESEDDAMPGLRTRLQALNPHAQRTLASYSESTATKLLDDNRLHSAIEQDDLEWGRVNAPRWQAYRATLVRWRERRTQLYRGRNGAEEELEFARVTLNLDPAADVRAPLMAALAQRPQHPAGLKALALALETLDPAQSQALTQRLYEISPRDRCWAAARMVELLENPVRDVGVLRHWREQLAAATEIQTQIQAQLHCGEPLTDCSPSDLALLDQEELLQTLRRQPEVERAWVARKVLPDFPGLSTYLLVLDLPSLDRLRAQVFCDELARLEGLLPGPCRVLPVQMGLNPLIDPLQPLDLLRP